MSTQEPMKDSRGRFTPVAMADRFWSKVDRTGGPDACWPWLASTNIRGYGSFWTGAGNQNAHRVAYVLTHGPEAVQGMVVDHLCRNVVCVNPRHLEPVTVRENVLRGEGLTAKQSTVTVCPHGHPYAGDNLRVSKGKRYCRTCARTSARHAA